MDPERRTKVISLRLSDHEFEQLKTASGANGARSVSDFARSAISNLKDLSHEELETGIKQLCSDVKQLGLDIRQLTDLVENHGLSLSSVPSATPNTDGTLIHQRNREEQ